MAKAVIAGREVAQEAAIAALAERLGASTHPLIAGLATDIAGAEAAHDLAHHLGAVLDHGAAEAVLADLGVMRGPGWLVTTPLEARAMADCVLLIGEIPADFPATPPPFAPDRARRVLRLAGGDLTRRVGVLRARIAGRRIAADADILAAADALRAAKYGVIVWSASEIAPLAIEMLSGLIADLNDTTRCFGLSIPAPGNAAGVIQALAWKSGFPIRLGYARGRAEHDPWRFAAARMIAAGETDAVLWIGDDAPKVPAGIFLAVLAPEESRALDADIVIPMAVPGRDCDGILFDAALGALRFQRASAPRPHLLRPADLLDAIAAQSRRELAAC